jgi:uncharacterized SAM-binding protein YcdF (DUF218 family)
MSTGGMSVDQAVRTAFDYLSATDPVDATPYDAVIGFGMFDLTLPRFCGQLYEQGLVRRIVFTGGIGAGTGNLGGCEADVWRQVLARSHPTIPDADVIVENQSTNTGENVAFTSALLRRHSAGLAFGTGLSRVVVVASPTRLRRVGLTLRRQHPELQVTRLRPPVALEDDARLYVSQGLDYVRHMAGELDRIVDYPRKGWIVDEPLPEAVAAARQVLSR